jgi:hypothetical protein
MNRYIADVKSELEKENETTVVRRAHKRNILALSNLSIFLLGRLPIGITSGTGSHESRTWGIAPSHTQPLRHCLSVLPALKAQ